MPREKDNIRPPFEKYLEILLVTCKDLRVYNFVHKGKMYGMEN
jgi:hypothetical protein